MASPSLYRRLLGPRFDALPGALRRFHDAPGGGRARGALRVVRPAGRLRNALASLAGLPRAGEGLPVRLEVEARGDRERWVRHFPGHRLVTVQWARGDLLMEACGPTTFASALVVDGPCLLYEFRRAWLLGLPLPRRLSPRVVGRVQADDNGWWVSVRVAAPGLGELVHYEGRVEPG